MRTKIVLPVIAAALVGLLHCSQDNFIPMTFNSVAPAVGVSDLDTSSWTVRTIAGYGMQVWHFQAFPGMNYMIEAQTPNLIEVYIFVKKSGLPDSLYINTVSFNESATRELFCTAEPCSVVLWVTNGSYAPVTYSLMLHTRLLYAAGAGSYADTLLGATPGKPIRKEINESEYKDTIGFDQPFAKYTYKVPLDSFEYVYFAYVERHESLSVQNARCYIESRRFDSVPCFSSHYFSSGQTYWNTAPDTILFTEYIDNGYGSGRLASNGISVDFLPQLFVTFYKKKFIPVEADAFDTAGHRSNLLKQDTLYSLSLRSYLERDSFCVRVSSDSIYQLIVNSPAGQRNCVVLQKVNSGFSTLCFDGKDTLAFRPDYLSSYINFYFYSPSNTPSSYTFSLSPYRGPQVIDSFEQDNSFAYGTPLIQGISQSHSIFPENEKDFFKIGCRDNDTFTIQINSLSTSAPPDSLGLIFVSYFEGTNVVPDLHQITHAFSGSVSSYRYCKSLADTVFFYAAASQYIEYSIRLIR